MPGPDGPTGWEELTDGVLVAAQPHGAPTWFPCNDRMADKATYRVTVRTDPGYRVVSNGTLTAERRSADGSSGCTSSASRWPPTSPRCRSGATCSSPRPSAAAPSAAGRPRRPDAGCSRRVRRPAPDARDLRRAVRALPVRRLHRGRHRRPARDPAGVADPVDLRHQPPQPRLGGAAAHRPRAGPPVVRQHGHCRLPAATSGCTRASPATPSGCGPRPSAAPRRRRRRAGTTPSSPGCPRTSCSPTPAPTRTFDDRVYKRGALTLHTLRRAVGDDAFFALLRAWVDTHRFGVVTTADFEAMVRTRTGVDPVAAARPVAARARPAAAGRRARGRRLTGSDGSAGSDGSTARRLDGSADDAERDEHARPEPPPPTHPVHDLAT